MSLSCSCGEWGGEGIAWMSPSDFSVLKSPRRKSCRSCKTMINIGSACLEFGRFRNPRNEIECKIYGEDGEIEMASWYHCESCGEIFLNLEAAGFCNQPDDDMRELMREYRELTGFQPAK